MTLTHTLRRPTAPKRNRPLAEVETEQAAKPLLGNIQVGQTKLRIKGFVLVLLLGIIVLTLLTMVNRYQNNMPCKAMMVEVIATEDNAFADSAMIRNHIVQAVGHPLEGEEMGTIVLKELEESVEENPYVKNAEVYKSIQGVLFVEADMRKPIARVMNEDGSQFYIDEYGHKFPTSSKHAANVPLVHGRFSEAIMPADSFECVTIETAIPLLKYINEQPFWNDLISDVAIEQDGELILYPRLGDIYVEFGQPIRITEKFENLRLFYNQVVKEIGWTKYKGVNLEIRGQVIGKRR